MNHGGKTIKLAKTLIPYTQTQMPQVADNKPSFYKKKDNYIPSKSA